MFSANTIDRDMLVIEFGGYSKQSESRTRLPLSSVSFSIYSVQGWMLYLPNINNEMRMISAQLMETRFEFSIYSHKDFRFFTFCKRLSVLYEGFEDFSYSPETLINLIDAYIGFSPNIDRFLLSHTERLRCFCFLHRSSITVLSSMFIKKQP